MGASGGGWRHRRHGERRRKDFFRKREHDDDNNNHIRGKEGVLRSQLREIHHAYAPGRSACRHSLRGLANRPRRGPCRHGRFKGLTAAGARKFCLVLACPHAAPPTPRADLASVGGLGRAVFGCRWAAFAGVERIPFYSSLCPGNKPVVIPCGAPRAERLETVDSMGFEPPD